MVGCPAPKPKPPKSFSIYTEIVVGVLDLLAFGLAFTGKISVSASRFFFLLAWGVMVYRLYRNLPPSKFRWSFWGGLMGITLTCFFLMWWARPEVVPGYFGTLTPSSHTLFSTEKKIFPCIRVGNSGTYFKWGGPSGDAIFASPEGPLLTIEVVNSQIKVSTQIRDKSGKIAAEIIQNEWKVLPPPGTWDRNYTSDALEVKDVRGLVVLQVKILPDYVQMQAEWWGTRGQGIRMVGADPKEGGALVPLFADYDRDEPRIRPMFRYPSDQHFGELVK